MRNAECGMRSADRGDWTEEGKTMRTAKAASVPGLSQPLRQERNQAFRNRLGDSLLAVGR